MAAALALVAAAAACGGNDGPGPASAEVTVPDPLASLAAPDPGRGVAVLGVRELRFTVTACEEGSGTGDTPLATRELQVTGRGEGGDGPFTVTVTRYRSDTGQGVPVVTETATVIYGDDDEARGIEAKRTTAGPGGTWLDLADPEADGPLVERVGDAVDVRATFGPRGARAGDAGLVEGRLRARCP